MYQVKVSIYKFQYTMARAPDSLPQVKSAIRRFPVLLASDGTLLFLVSLIQLMFPCKTHSLDASLQLRRACICQSRYFAAMPTASCSLQAVRALSLQFLFKTCSRDVHCVWYHAGCSE
ncbi:unnamed protein product [Polarella glacialis]|uniref:Uncharacterized protein n=1 Tax=Polarella glacialis TaxID=89957 RepID=A0A813KKA9_POLGL|nr:unnamed protein product [Polarella glacialis]CAE8703352.1 unnamed protein product [Polarella glacialis]